MGQHQRPASHLKYYYVVSMYHVQPSEVIRMVALGGPTPWLAVIAPHKSCWSVMAGDSHSKGVEVRLHTECCRSTASQCPT